MSSFYAYSLQDQGRQRAGITDAEPLTPPPPNGGGGKSMSSRQMSRAGMWLIVGGVILWAIGFFMK